MSQLNKQSFMVLLEANPNLLELIEQFDENKETNLSEHQEINEFLAFLSEQNISDEYQKEINELFAFLEEQNIPELQFEDLFDWAMEFKLQELVNEKKARLATQGFFSIVDNNSILVPSVLNPSADEDDTFHYGISNF